MEPGHDGKVWHLGACCWEDRKVPQPEPEITPIEAKRYPAKDDVGNFDRAPAAKKRKRA